MRARYPDTEGFIERDGVKVGYEVFGAGEPAVVFPPIDGIVHSRCWKAQVPYLARFFKVVTIDPRGNGRSDRPQGYRPNEKVCVVTVGGSGVGTDLLRRVAAAFPEAKRLVPEALAAAIAEEVARPVSYRPVETDGAKRAAALLAELI